MRKSLVDYIEGNGIALSLDLRTDSKEAFIDAFLNHILKPRQFNYKMQFTGPTGANAVEAAIKLARKATGRTNIIAFTNAFHGCSLGALSLTANSHNRSHSGALLTNVTRAPYDGYFGERGGEAIYLEKLLSDPSGGCDLPAAIVLETIQGEGGLNVASRNWAQSIQRIARKLGALLIVDDIQAGCGRSGSFFSFEGLGIDPDIVVLAKSISGFGLPMSLVLMKPDFDVWAPGEHNGTFRGNNHAFVTATSAINVFWSNDGFAKTVGKLISKAHEVVSDICEHYRLRSAGRGLMIGIDLKCADTASTVRRLCFERGLIAETCGPHGEILKLLPPLTTAPNALDDARSIISDAVADATRSVPQPVEV